MAVINKQKSIMDMSIKELEEYTERYDALEKMSKEIILERKKKKELLARQQLIPETYIGQSVNHKTFNMGVIVDKTGDLITVSFDIGEKKFKLPEAINEGFITLL